MQGIQIRKWTLQDRDALVALFAAADRRFLSDRLPDPYTEKDADFWLRRVCEQDGAAGIFRAVTVGDVVAGSVSIEQKEDVYRKDADIGYFLVGAQWSKGIMTEAVRQRVTRPSGSWTSCGSQGRSMRRTLHPAGCWKRTDSHWRAPCAAGSSKTAACRICACTAS